MYCAFIIILFSHIDTTGSDQNWCGTPFKCIRVQTAILPFRLSSFQAVLLVFNEFQSLLSSPKMAGCTPYFCHLRIPRPFYSSDILYTVGILLKLLVYKQFMLYYWLKGEIKAKEVIGMTKIHCFERYMMYYTSKSEYNDQSRVAKII